MESPEVAERVIGFAELKVTVDVPFRSVSSRSQVFFMPGGRQLFCAELGNGLDILVVAEPQVPDIQGYVSQKVCIFDKEFTFAYKGELVLSFRVTSCGAGYYSAYVDTVCEGERCALGAIKVYAGDMVLFDGEVIEAVKARRLHTKAVMLNGN